MPCSMPSSRAQISGTSPSPSARGRGGRELGGDVVGGGEDDAHEVVVVDRVALEHLRHERLRLGVDLRFGVLVEGCRAAQSQDFHGIGG